MRPLVRERITIGFRLSRAALAAWGTDRFWSYLSWWHEEIHYTIPAEKLQAEIESVFQGKGVNTLSTGISLRTISPRIDFKIDSPLSSVPGSVGAWQFENVSVQTSKKPHLLRRGVMWLVMGARWESNKSAELLPPEYTRLNRFLEVRG
jgi:hypothetical protein